ncbi:hypothetical protein C8K36_101595 [Rhodococcus sp. OK519]|uniref:hypothetical protein n=1 Tax=Rhodococcus sp. OK519 TaxID=2135729 RepID=UPI000D3A492F|nr:hypothetical protein C8K36_101595 [Rhodococcus sp. OK519]
MTTEPFPPPASCSATAVNRAHTVAVSATETGLPLDIRIDRRELRYGGERLAAEILRLCGEAGREAGTRRREQLARDGVPAGVLDRLGLPTRAQVAAMEHTEDESQPAPTTWMRPA